MSKIIKVDDKVYDELDKLRAKGETFGEIIAMLLNARIRVLELWSLLEGQLKYSQWREQELRKLQTQTATYEKQREEG